MLATPDCRALWRGFSTHGTQGASPPSRQKSPDPDIQQLFGGSDSQEVPTLSIHDEPYPPGWSVLRAGGDMDDDDGTSTAFQPVYVCSPKHPGRTIPRSRLRLAGCVVFSGGNPSTSLLCLPPHNTHSLPFPTYLGGAKLEPRHSWAYICPSRASRTSGLPEREREGRGKDHSHDFGEPANRPAGKPSFIVLGGMYAVKGVKSPVSL